MTITIRGNKVVQAEAAGYHAHCEDWVTTIDLGDVTEEEARGIARVMGWIIVSIVK